MINLHAKEISYINKFILLNDLSKDTFVACFMNLVTDLLKHFVDFSKLILWVFLYFCVIAHKPSINLCLTKFE